MKLLDDPCVVLGGIDEPDNSHATLTRTIRGAVARMLVLSSARNEPTVWVIERRFPRLRIRGYHAMTDRTWLSRGVMEFSLLEYAGLWVRALRAKREPIPRAWVP